MKIIIPASTVDNAFMVWKPETPPPDQPHALAWFDWLWSCPTAAWVSGSWIPLGCRAGARLHVNARPRHRACTLMPRPLTLLSPSSLGNSLPPPLSPLLPLAVNEPGKAVMPPPRPPVPHTSTHLPHFLFTLFGLPVTPVQSSRTRFSCPKVLFFTSVKSHHLSFVLQTYFVVFL